MSYKLEEYAQKEVDATSEGTPRTPLTVQELLDHPERQSELYPDGKTHQDTIDAAERAEDAYYDALGEEIERHPICSPTLARRNRTE